MRDRAATFIIGGDPIPKARARLRYGYHKRFFDIQHKEKIEQRIDLIEQMGNTQKFIGPCHMDITFFMPIHPSTKYSPGDPMYYRPDLDNLTKWVCDVFLHAVYDDDCIITELSCSKIYDNVPRTEITIKELPYVEKKRSSKKQLLPKI